ncbi:MAG: hypothetical protein J6K52_03900 [Clostridia bacterium]|nr:hypothetical protein [Clostridia bacterium]MBP3495329.1 hypothetical protein [Clostridia bacterium]
MLKKHKNKIIISSLVVIGILLILFGSFSKNESDVEENEFNYELYTNELEEKIERFLLSVSGIDNVNVIVTLDNSSEIVYAQNQSTLDFLTINSGNGQSPVYVTEIYPCVRGIAIACTNGDRDDVRAKITKLISAYLGISSNRIEIVNFG